MEETERNKTSEGRRKSHMLWTLDKDSILDEQVHDCGAKGN